MNATAATRNISGFLGRLPGFSCLLQNSVCSFQSTPPFQEGYCVGRKEGPPLGGNRLFSGFSFLLFWSSPFFLLLFQLNIKLWFSYCLVLGFLCVLLGFFLGFGLINDETTENVVKRISFLLKQKQILQVYFFERILLQVYFFPH